MVGGTGLYINTVIDNIKFSETICDNEFREKMKNVAQKNGNFYIYNMLKEIDPIAAKKLHVNDIRRIIRALEVYEYTKIPISKHQEDSRKEPSPYNTVYFALNMERKKLYSRINKRVDMMIENGLINEVRDLLYMGYTKELTSMKGLGYKEVIDYLEGNLSFDKAIEIIKRDTRRYAKRQLTWFRRDKRINWINVDEYDNIKKIITKCLYIIEKNGIIYYNRNNT